MTRDEVIDLLTMAAAFDSRTVGESDLEAWQAVATACGWTAHTARRALIEHYGHDTDRLVPAHLTQIIEAERNRIRRTYDPVPPPVVLRDDPAAERTWLRERARQHVRSGLDEWATGSAPRELPGPPPPE